MKSKLQLKATGSSIINSTPPFASTMLAAGVFKLRTFFHLNIFECFEEYCVNT